MKQVKDSPNIYTYLDFRAYLKDYYVWAKSERRGFSYRRFSQLAGLSSSNFLKLVIDGKRNIGDNSLEGISNALKLNEMQARFFEDLVEFGQAKTPTAAARVYKRLSKYRERNKVHTLEGGLYDYFTHWFYPAIRELAARDDFTDDPVWLSKQLLPSISPAEAKRAFEVLEELKLLQRDKEGSFQRGETSVTTGSEVQRRAIIGYHHQMLERSGASIQIVPQEEREISAMTVCISANRFAEIKQRLQQFRDEILDYCDTDTDPERVYQLNIQFFPLSRAGDEE